jgi:hypothetical protein
MCVYNWRTWAGYLLPTLFRKAISIDAKPGDSAEDILVRLPSDFTHFAFHLCLSLKDRFPTSRGYLVEELNARGISVLNGYVVNTTKRYLHAVCHKAGLPCLAAGQDGPLEELLIAKSNCNYGAEAERRLEPALRKVLALAEPSISIANSMDYHILRRCDVPMEFWRDPGIILERFVSNVNDIFFRVHVCGRHVVVERVIDPLPIKKMPVGLSCKKAFLYRSGQELVCINSEFECSTTLISMLGVFIEEFRLDFGALDVVYEEPDAYFVIDVNDTPYWGNDRQSELHDFLRAGLIFLP